MRNKKSHSKEKYARPDTYQGDIRLQIESAENYLEVTRFYEILKKVDNLSIVSYNWSEKEGLNIIISLKKPKPLGDILLKIPQVQLVEGNKKTLTVTLNTTTQGASLSDLEAMEEEALAS